MLADKCTISNSCRNKDKRCYVCQDYDQYLEKKYLNHNQIRKTPSKRKKGMEFEEKVVKEYNNYMAQRKPLSGGIWGFEGDIEVIDMLWECKERDEELVGGQKSISIKKEWHDRIKSEALKNNKLPAIIYRYKSFPDEIYFSMEFNHLLELLYRIKTLTEENEKLKKLLEG